jgi:hypothetical protein
MHKALEAYITNHKKNLMELKGKVTFNEDYDYKAMSCGFHEPRRQLAELSIS